jgi:uncharacterized membrane protein
MHLGSSAVWLGGMMYAYKIFSDYGASLQMQKRKSQKARRSAKRSTGSAEQPFSLEASNRRIPFDKELTQTQLLEGRIVIVLILLFGCSLLEGLLVAGSVRLMVIHFYICFKKLLNHTVGAMDLKLYRVIVLGLKYCV